MMSRSRSIKPQFFTSDDVHSLPIPARLTFVGLWVFADDYGNERYDPHLIKAAIWPRERAVSLKALEGHLAMLVDRGMIVLYTVNGKAYFHVANWETYQRVDRPSQSSIPDCPRELLASVQRPARGPLGNEGGESVERDESEGGERADSRDPDRAPSPFCSKHPNGTNKPCRDCGTARLRLKEWENARDAA